MVKAVKVNWFDEELDKYYRKMGEPEEVWKDNEGMPFGIYYYENWDSNCDEQLIEVEWFKTEEERDASLNQYELRREIHGISR